MTADSPLARLAEGRTDLVHELPAEAHAEALPWCAYYGDVSALRLLLARGAVLTALGDDLGLNAAAFHGHWQLCEFLLEAGADTDHALPDTGETPLHAALVSQDRERYDRVVEVLLAAGADVAARTRAGVATGAFMRDSRTRGETPLHRAAAFGGVATLTLLLDAGADREARDAYGDTPLGWASWYRRPAEILRPLCYGEHRIRADYAGLRAHLIGRPLVRR